MVVSLLFNFVINWDNMLTANTKESSDEQSALYLFYPLLDLPSHPAEK